jgi:hypothetical protein
MNRGHGGSEEDPVDGWRGCRRRGAGGGEVMGTEGAEWVGGGKGGRGALLSKATGGSTAENASSQVGPATEVLQCGHHAAVGDVVHRGVAFQEVGRIPEHCGGRG